MMMMLLRGGNRLNLRVVSSYQPQMSTILYKVYQQQVQYYNETGNNNAPLTNYDKGLTNLIIKLMDNGNQVLS